MLRRFVVAALPLAFAPSVPAAEPALVVKHAAGLTITLDVSQAHPGGLLIARLRAARPLAAAVAQLDGRRAWFFATREGPRALVGIPATATPGPTQLGIELHGRRGRRRIAVPFVIASRELLTRATVLPPDRLALLTSREALRDSRRLLAALRTASPTAYWNGPLKAPVAATPLASFGVREQNPGRLPLNELLDGEYGEYHRGLDYPVPAGTIVQAPGPGTVVLCAALAVAGQSVVIDHGHGLVSLVCHLGRIDVTEGQWIEGRTPLGVSGDSGAAAGPLVHWGTYLSGVAVDPGAIMSMSF